MDKTYSFIVVWLEILHLMMIFFVCVCVQRYEFMKMLSALWNIIVSYALVSIFPFTPSQWNSYRIKGLKRGEHCINIQIVSNA